MELHSLTRQNVLRSKSLSDRHRCGEREDCLVLAYSAWMLSLNYRSVDSRLKVRRTQKNRRCAWAGLELCLFDVALRRPRRGLFVLVSSQFDKPEVKSPSSDNGNWSIDLSGFAIDCTSMIYVRLCESVKNRSEDLRSQIMKSICEKQNSFCIELKHAIDVWKSLKLHEFSSRLIAIIQSTSFWSFVL